MPTTHIAIKVGTEPTPLFWANPKRIEYIIFNNGSVVVEKVSQKGNVYGDGIPIAVGQAWGDDQDQEDVFVVSSGTGQDVRGMEVLRD